MGKNNVDNNNIRVKVWKCRAVCHAVECRNDIAAFDDLWSQWDHFEITLRSHRDHILITSRSIEIIEISSRSHRDNIEITSKSHRDHIEITSGSLRASRSQSLRSHRDHIEITSEITSRSHRDHRDHHLDQRFESIEIKFSNKSQNMQRITSILRYQAINYIYYWDPTSMFDPNSFMYDLIFSMFGKTSIHLTMFEPMVPIFIHVYVLCLFAPYPIQTAWSWLMVYGLYGLMVLRVWSNCIHVWSSSFVFEH